MLIVALLAAWTMWFVLARVPVYESSLSARIEVDGAARPIDAPLAGRIVLSNLALARRVRAGDILAELDAEPLVIERRELDAKLQGLSNEIAALQREITAEHAAVSQATSASDFARREAMARAEEGNAAAKLAKEELDRATRLHASGLIGDLDLLRSRAEAEKRQAVADGLRLSVLRQRADDDLKQKERLSRHESLGRELASLEGQQRSIVVNIERLEHEIERRRIRAPISGTLADVALVKSGSVVAEGDRLATLICDGHLDVVASFSPNAIGRLRTGQSGRLRLAGYPWQQYGALPVVVAHVASELRDSQIRVELRLDAPASNIPLQHALPGTVELEVERISPAALILRAAGRRIS
ncbi:MAG TPA: HlyD family efflux transporter periplasmic adaptor subunit [Thermoanaerobaculia bacterium]|nr:HlyD family efflux transporter periplasmic adaptor subunit [Thermoanaerobaculia bacterium]